MAQTPLKKKASTTTKKRTASTLGPRNIAPKKQTLIKQKKLNKKLTSGLVTRTERTLAQKAGHLEMLAGGKKSEKEKEKEKEKAKKK
ncbi:hypothetical protein BDW42DRAFT_191534 [Aspergillus taichungensis]|uniref:Uncharacterized protein n=1 Tax=Aspergillus taichungensis TaxID=482145 RepID=A0A2J5I3H8_9EURO|nr:hypothetical protein BDW42DRAFT_191534 [Aspergillus taichungensis]